MNNKILAVACLSIALMSCASTQSVKLANNSVHIKYDRATAFNPEPTLDGMMHEAMMRCGTASPTLIADSCAWSNGIFCFSWTYIYDCGSEDGTVEIQATHEIEPERKPKSVRKATLVAEPEQQASDDYQQCLREISGRLPEEFCDRRK